MDTFQQLKSNSLEVGLTINEKKTEYLKCAKNYIKIENLNIRSSYIEQVKQYKYVGSIIQDLGQMKIKNWLTFLMPNVNYSGRTAPLTSKVAFYIFIQQI